MVLCNLAPEAVSCFHATTESLDESFPALFALNCSKVSVAIGKRWSDIEPVTDEQGKCLIREFDMPFQAPDLARKAIKASGQYGLQTISGIGREEGLEGSLDDRRLAGLASGGVIGEPAHHISP